MQPHDAACWVRRHTTIPDPCPPLAQADDALVAAASACDCRRFRGQARSRGWDSDRDRRNIGVRGMETAISSRARISEQLTSRSNL